MFLYSYIYLLSSIIQQVVAAAATIEALVVSLLHYFQTRVECKLPVSERVRASISVLCVVRVYIDGVSDPGVEQEGQIQESNRARHHSSSFRNVYKYVCLFCLRVRARASKFMMSVAVCIYAICIFEVEGSRAEQCEREQPRYVDGGIGGKRIRIANACLLYKYRQLDYIRLHQIIVVYNSIACISFYYSN